MPPTWLSSAEHFSPRRGDSSSDVGADELDIDGGGQAEIQDLGDDVGRQEVKSGAWEFAREIVCGVRAWTYFCGGPVVLVEGYEDVGIFRTDGRRGAVGM